MTLPLSDHRVKADDTVFEFYDSRGHPLLLTATAGPMVRHQTYEAR